MKPEFEKIESKSFKSFMARVVIRDKRPLLSKAWHYHPEFEICYTVKSKGLRYVGNNISEYKENDLVILGSNLPHGFTTPDECKQYVIQFHKNFLGKDFFNAIEMKNILNLLANANRGLLLIGDDLKVADKKILSLFEPRQSNTTQLFKLLDFLDFLSLSSSLKSICSEKYSSGINVSKLNSIKKIFEFVENNFQKELTIKEASKVVNLTESAFYKFIKRHTNKKFTTIVNEYRIDHAYKLLASSNLPISEIAYASGYNNFSHFNRMFKETYKMTPRQFRRND